MHLKVVISNMIPKVDSLDAKSNLLGPLLVNSARQFGCWSNSPTWGKGTEVDQSCFNDPVKWIKDQVSEPPPAKEFAEEIHGFGEYYKYRHVCQAIATANL